MLCHQNAAGQAGSRQHELSAEIVLPMQQGSSCSVLAFGAITLPLCWNDENLPSTSRLRDDHPRDASGDTAIGSVDRGAERRSVENREAGPKDSRSTVLNGAA